MHEKNQTHKKSGSFIYNERNKLQEITKTDNEHSPPYENNLQIPLINGNIMNIPLASINISEEVNKTGIWKQVNSSNKMKNRNDGKDSKKAGKKMLVDIQLFTISCILESYSSKINDIGSFRLDFV